MKFKIWLLNSDGKLKLSFEPNVVSMKMIIAQQKKSPYIKKQWKSAARQKIWEKRLKNLEWRRRGEKPWPKPWIPRKKSCNVTSFWRCNILSNLRMRRCGKSYINGTKTNYLLSKWLFIYLKSCGLLPFFFVKTLVDSKYSWRNSDESVCLVMKKTYLSTISSLSNSRNYT